MITITIGRLPAVERALSHLASLPIRAPAAVQLARLVRAVDGVAADVRRRRDALVASHAIRDADGDLVPASDPEMRERGMVRLDPERAEALEEELERLLNERVEIPGPPLNPDHLRREDGRSVDLPAGVLIDLGPLFDDATPSSPGS